MDAVQSSLILIVDDAPENLALVTSLLTTAGYQVRAANSGARALSVLQRMVPDLILLDVKMPDMDGFEACRQIKQDQRLRDIPVVFMSGLHQTEAKVEGFDVGAVDFVSKPMDARELLARVETHISLARTRHQLNKANEQLEDYVGELSSSRAKYYDLYEHSPECLLSIDIETGRILECNSRVPQKLGMSRQDIIGRDMLSLYDEASHELAKESFEKLKREGEIRDVQLKVKRVNGTTFDVLLDSVGFFDAAGRMEFTRSSWSDISERIKLEKDLRDANAQLQELDRMKSMFVASVSHELRTPLNSIIGFSGMILDGVSGSLNEEQRDGLTRVNRAGKHLLALVSDVIDISKIESGRVEVNPENFSLEEVVENAIGNVQPDLIAKGLEVTRDAPSWPIMRTDRKRLFQCLLNYLSNAVKFTEAGTITVRVREDGDWVDISVEDTGIGIPDSEFPKLFEAFERVDSHLKIKAGGTGLGLYLVKQIATTVLGGDVSMESQVGKGSVFSLRIPRDIKGAKSNAAKEQIVVR